MATTISQSFDEYASNLEITDNQATIVSNCRENVTNAIDKILYLHTEKSKVIGSWDRNTLIRYLSENDVDLMVVLHYGKNKIWDSPNGTSTVLDKFKEILDNAYPKTPNLKDRNCVTLKLSNFKLDVVPAFKVDDGEDGYYKIPDTWRTEWLPTNPFKFAEKITDVNKNMNDTFVPIIKMVKGWNRENGNFLRNFHLENMLYSHYESYKQDYSYWSTIKVFFNSLPDYLNLPSFDPVTSDRLDEYLDNTSSSIDRQTAIQRAKQAASLSSQAYQYGDDGYAHQSIDKWKELFGEFFPSYG